MNPIHNKSNNNEFIFGIHPLLEALNKDIEIDKVIIQAGIKSPHIQELKRMLTEREIPVQVVPQEKLARITRSNHQGIIGFVSPVTFVPLEEILQQVYEAGRDPFLLVLDRVTDVRNFGAICRTAECVGIDAVIVPARGSARIGGDAVKTSAGALLNMNICRSFNLKDTLDYLKNSGIQLVACTEKTDTYIYDSTFSGPTCIVMGSEEDGISPEYLKKCDKKVKIPMVGKTSSLNVSVAAAIVMYEVFKGKSL